MRVRIGFIAVAGILAGCSSGSSEVASPPAGDPLTYSARTIPEFDAAEEQADHYCRINQGVPARYVSRTYETATFACATE